jgi:predicted amidophosphoribosyltransferase
VNGVFACRDRRLDGKYVILVDDVCTTGSTLEACAVALKKSNVPSVWGITVAREI